MAQRKISESVGKGALLRVMFREPGEPYSAEELDIALHAGVVSREELATAVRFLLQLLALRATGKTVEVRVPPFGAVQCIPGPGHSRGTPPNVIEMDAFSWLSLAMGTLSWQSALESGRVHASGQRADLREYLPLYPPFAH